MGPVQGTMTSQDLARLIVSGRKHSANSVAQKILIGRACLSFLQGIASSDTLDERFYRGSQCGWLVNRPLANPIW